MLTVRNFALVASLMLATAAQAETMQNQLDALTQLEELRTEMQTLRGDLEVTQHELAQLKQQQRDYYDDLNQRLNELTKKDTVSASVSPAVVNPPQATVVNTTNTTPDAYSGASGQPAQAPNIAPGAIVDTTTAEAAVVNANGDLPAYQVAYGFLQNKKYPEAVAAFNTYLSTYPQGEYVANVDYWLGEVYLIQHQYPKAEQAFSQVVNKYPSHQKAGDALLKLGYVYEANGDKQKALDTFLQVQQKYPNTTVAQLAQTKASQIH